MANRRWRSEVIRGVLVFSGGGIGEEDLKRESRGLFEIQMGFKYWLMGDTNQMRCQVERADEVSTFVSVC